MTLVANYISFCLIVILFICIWGLMLYNYASYGKNVHTEVAYNIIIIQFCMNDTIMFILARVQ